ncbi:nuclease-related domain-containing protein [Metabacillus endolithicus]|uniref:Nuclease-related domain-containing protein n=3 Tax=Metabacillus endolithicus TaxID=1535204 RepID=A0ABW5BZG6_9BACI
MFFNIFKKKDEKEIIKEESKNSKDIIAEKKTKEYVAARKGEIGEYKIDIQLAQLPKEYKYLSDIMVTNPKSISGFSQIDHVVITPYGIFVIETKNYQGTIYGGRERKEWSVNGKFKMMNPFFQNYGHIKVLKDLVDKKLHNHFFSLVSFTKRCTFKVDQELRKISSDDLILYDIELSEFIHRKVSVVKLQDKTPVLSSGEIDQIYSIISKANITDSKLREQHSRSINDKKEEKKSIESKKKCTTCGQPVSEKVAAYCLSNKKFDGKIYCYDHQKTTLR